MRLMTWHRDAPRGGRCGIAMLPVVNDVASRCSPGPAARDGTRDPLAPCGCGEAGGQGLPLVHFSPLPEPFLSLKLHETTPNVCRRKSSRQLEKWTSVSPWRVGGVLAGKGGVNPHVCSYYCKYLFEPSFLVSSGSS
jgi:hypothetical protein